MNKAVYFTAGILRLTLERPRDLRHVLGVANWALSEILDPLADTRCFERVTLDQLDPASHRWSFQSFPGVGASISLAEAAALAVLVRKSNAKRVFEFGTYKGVSTTQLALNLPPGGMVFTLDLPEDHPAYCLEISKPEEREIAGEKGKGILIPDDLLQKVTFLKSDSATFDTTPYRSSIDLVFVDGAHSFDYVKNDTEKALEMLKPGGIVAWHDCTPTHRDVVRYLQSLPAKPQLVAGTAIAFYVKKS